MRIQCKITFIENKVIVSLPDANFLSESFAEELRWQRIDTIEQGEQCALFRSRYRDSLQDVFSNAIELFFVMREWMPRAICDQLLCALRESHEM